MSVSAPLLKLEFLHESEQFSQENYVLTHVIIRRALRVWWVGIVLAIACLVIAADLFSSLSGNSTAAGLTVVGIIFLAAVFISISMACLYGPDYHYQQWRSEQEYRHKVNQQALAYIAAGQRQQIAHHSADHDVIK